MSKLSSLLNEMVIGVLIAVNAVLAVYLGFDKPTIMTN